MRPQLPQARFSPEDEVDRRSASQRDRDRILYAGAFARLAEITQVVSPEHGYVFHNRLTHSLKVGQIARRLAEKSMREQPAEAAVLGLDPDAAEAAGLAHDMGHPPFGHVAEEELNRLVIAAGLPDGYEGNAQSFRIVVRLSASDARDPDDLPIPGLNLTARTLDGILKYPWGHGNKQNPHKWGYYQSERDVFAWVRAGRPPHQRSAIAEIMDWADDVTFAIHDLLDFYCAGRVPIDRCKGSRSAERKRLIHGMFLRKPQWRTAEGDYIEALDSIIDAFPFEPDEKYTDSASDRARLYDFSTGLIGYFLESFQLNPASSESLARIDPDARRTAEVMKQFIWEYVIKNPELAVVQSGQRTAIRTVFACLLDAAKHQESHLFPASYRGEIEAAKTKSTRVRAVSDCISGMTEKEVIHYYRRLQAISG